jgi:hypothetical protein
MVDPVPVPRVPLRVIVRRVTTLVERMTRQSAGEPT